MDIGWILPLRESSNAAGDRSRCAPLDDPGLALDGTRRGAGSISVWSEGISDGGVSRSPDDGSGVSSGGKDGSDLSSSMAAPFDEGFSRREGFLADFLRRLSVNVS